ncbi:MAG TPA: hypothetical protein VLB68_17590, partial [Pyrinomonadaceae bacterium]|nr:hypothetical protein [Pyrinomonadaceae bacterium]
VYRPRSRFQRINVAGDWLEKRRRAGALQGRVVGAALRGRPSPNLILRDMRGARKRSQKVELSI